MKHALALSAAVSACVLSCPARAAESYDNCSGFVDSLPAVISAQGVWCLRSDLSTAIGSGAAILIDANNVTLDCNDFKVGGLAAGPSTLAVGIYSPSARNTVVRNCNVRGFDVGLSMAGAGGTNLVEDNRFEGSRSIGINVSSDGAIVRRSLVLDTGGESVFTYGIATFGSVDVIDNTVTGITAASNAVAYGIYMGSGTGSRVSGNMVRGIDDAAGTASTYGIYGIGGGFAIVDNQVHGPLQIGVRCGNPTGIARDNIVFNTSTALSSCTSVDNILDP